MILNAFGELAAGGGESFPAERKNSSGSADIQISLFTGQTSHSAFGPLLSP